MNFRDSFVLEVVISTHRTVILTTIMSTRFYFIFLNIFSTLPKGPIGISPRNSDDPPLKAGMFLSDEPGYYEDGAFGIRIENIIQVVEKTLKV